MSFDLQIITNNKKKCNNFLQLFLCFLTNSFPFYIPSRVCLWVRQKLPLYLGVLLLFFFFSLYVACELKKQSAWFFPCTSVYTILYINFCLLFNCLIHQRIFIIRISLSLIVNLIIILYQPQISLTVGILIYISIMTYMVV